MKYVDEFRDKRLIDKLATDIRREADAAGRRFRFMEVCGTHTMNVFRFGLRDLLPEKVGLISGPGCPVCVTPNSYIDKAIALANTVGIIVATFGDLFRVPGSYSSLEKERASGASIKMVYSTLDAIELARGNPDKEVVFLGIGFETTIPTVAQSILIAKKGRLRNYSVLCGHKTMPAVMAALAKDRDIRVDGFLLPGHVSAVTGTGIYKFLSVEYGMRCVVSGFEPVDILQSLLMLIKQGRPRVEIEYSRIIRPAGNAVARRIMDKVFDPVDSEWRGIGVVRGSGLRINKAYRAFDAESRFNPKTARPKENSMCICGRVLKGSKTPLECRLFGKVCRPENPVGACMVSSEGTCAAYYRYKRGAE